MVFLSGPRQVGKTTLSKDISRFFKNSLYFSWDILSNKKTLLTNPVFFQDINRIDSSNPLIIFDEIHKYDHWKNYLKGMYDEFKDEYRFLVSGSGRLDIYKKGGDSLAGRYFTFRLFPFTVAELSPTHRNFNAFLKNPLKGFDLNNKNVTKKHWDRLSKVSGFPEPYTNGTAKFYNKWSVNYYHQIIREDIRDIINIKKIDSVEILFSLLPSKIGSPLSINNLAQNIQVTFDSVKNWLRLFELLYLVFRISPWTKKINRSILKEKKLYLYNYSEIQDAGAKFENMVALELLRAITNWNDYGFGEFKLHFIKTKEKQEVDFLIVQNNKPFLLVETKFSDTNVSKTLLQLQEQLQIPAIQLVNTENVYKHKKNGNNHISILTAHEWLSSLS